MSQEALNGWGPNPPVSIRPAEVRKWVARGGCLCLRTQRLYEGKGRDGGFYGRYMDIHPPVEMPSLS